MSYTALYRKFRPAVFEDVKGQDHIVTTLKNQIVNSRIGHAYLFCGTRGTGKTTIAKIFARAVNCENPQEGNPCGECAVCRSIASGSSMNVIEMDAASNNGVENVRGIVEEVAYCPVEGKYKVYIIDEVHMLSGAAFNALLKTLEEPPAYVIFILATTEMHKIPVTILSRCQRYDFRRISIDTIKGRLQELMEIEKVEAEEKALRYIAKAADGSMRDSLSLLEQCIAFNYGKLLTYDMVLEVLGATDIDVFSILLRKIVQEDIIGCIDLLEQAVMQGREMSQFVLDFTWYLRNLMLLKASGEEGAEDVLDVSTENLKRLREEADMLEMGQLFRYIGIFSELSGRLRYSMQKRILIEMTLVKICRPQMEQDQEAVLERVRSLEKKVEEGITVNPVNYENTSQPGEKKKPRPVLDRAIPEDIKKIEKEWPVVLGKAEGLVRTLLSKARHSLGTEGQLLLCYDDRILAEQMKRPEMTEEVKKLLSDHVGKEILVEIGTFNQDKEFEEEYVDIMKMINMEVETIE